MPPDSAAVDAALVAKLGADVTLLGLMPNGVYVDVAPPRSTRFVIVSLLEHHDEQEFGGRAIESALYLVKAVGLSTANPDMAGAAARIDELLDGGVLTPTGFDLMAMHREERVRITEVDDADPSIRWYHRGGHYRVEVST